MDDIEVWLRTDLVRFDFCIWCVGYGKADVLLSTGLGACGRGVLHLRLEEGGQGSSPKLPFPFQHVEPGGAGSGHSLSATELHTDVGRPLSRPHICGGWSPALTTPNTLDPPQFFLNGGGVCLSGFLLVCFCFILLFILRE